MTDAPSPLPDTTPRAALRNWSGSARHMINAAFLLMTLSTLSWIGFAWGVGAYIGASAQGTPENTPLLVAACSITIRTLASYLADQQADKAGRAMTAAARRDVFSAINRNGARLMAGASSGERGAQIIDRTAALSGYAAHWLPGVRLSVAGPLIILAAASFQSWLAAALLCISVMTLPLFIWLTASGTAAAARAQQASLDTLSGAFQARAAQAGLIRAFRAIGRETAYLEDVAEELRIRTMRILRIAFLSTSVVEFFASVSIALVAVYVGFKLLGVFPFPTGETLTLAEGMTVLILAPEFFAPIRRLSSLHHDRANGKAAADMIAPWLTAASAINATRIPALPAAPHITFKNATLSHDGTHPGVSPISFTAKPGQITVLWGPSGSGKTTLLLGLIGQTRILHGAIHINQRSLLSGDSLANSVAWFRQTPWMVEGSLADNISLAAPGASQSRIEDAAARAGILDFAPLDQGGLSRHLGRFGTGLSGGQKQRLAMARAILRNSPVWLMDEPTAHLDPDAEADFLAQLKGMSQERTIIIATHSPAVRAIADQIVSVRASTEKAASSA